MDFELRQGPRGVWMSEDSLRVVLLTNSDFALDPPGPAALDPTHSSRVDVLNVERDVAQALVAWGAEVRRVVVRGTEVASALDEIRRIGPSLVFNLCESIAYDSRHEIVMPALLDLMAISYTGGGPLALGLALDKPAAKRVLAGAGVPTPAGAVVERIEELDSPSLRPLIGTPPLFCKLAHEDASVGITHESVCHDEIQLRRQVAALLRQFRQPVLIERYIEGREIYVSVLGDREPAVLGRHEIDFSAMPGDRPRIVSYEGKWVPASVEYVGSRPVPCDPIDGLVAARLDRVAIDSFRALGLRDYGRIDVRLAADGVPYVIDVNPNCDLSREAGYSRAARLAGVSYEEVIARICELALLRANDNGRQAGSGSIALRRTA